MRARFGKYRLLTTLGRGGMAEVFLAVLEGEANSRKLLVVKCIRTDLTSDPDLLGMFLDEARLALRLNHPNVVQTFEVDVVEGEYFLAMEYLDGQPLNQLRTADKQKPGTFPLGMKLQIVADALRGLHYAHELRDYDGVALGVVHRDVSPHNLFVTYEGQTKVVDFGIAKAAGRLQEATKMHVGPKGKVRYMSPEQARAETVDGRADVFAMGIVLWELLTGQRVWGEREDMEVLIGLYHDQLPSLEAEIDPALLAICAQAMAPRREDRYASAEVFRQAVARYQTEHGLHISGVDLGERLRQVFAARKAEADQLIVTQMRALPPAPSVLPETTRTSVPIELASLAQTGSSVSAGTQIDQRGRHRLAVWAGFGGVSVVATGLMIFWMGSSPGDSALGPSAASVASLASPSATAATHGEPSARAVPSASAPAVASAPASAPAVAPTAAAPTAGGRTGPAGKRPVTTPTHAPPPDTSLPAFLP